MNATTPVNVPATAPVYMLICPKCGWSCVYSDGRMTCWECRATLETTYLTPAAPVNLNDTVVVHPNLRDAMRAAIDSSEPRTKGRNKALAAVKWVLACEGGGYVKLSEVLPFPAIVVPDAGDAEVFDGRDNEALKAAAYERALGVACTPTLLSELN